MSNLTTVSTVVSVLGGNQAVATVTRSNPKSVTNWKASNRFPAATYVTLVSALKKKGFIASENLWPMRGSKRKARR